MIHSHRGPYRVHFGPLFDGLREGLAPREHLLIDAAVARAYAGPLARALAAPSVLRIDATEASKSLEQIPAYVTHLLSRGVRRDHVLIAVGGGVIQDIAAFLAATLLRGLPWRFYPTTLLAQADSCIGSKSSINVGPYKNQLGTFTPPEEIRISMDVLDTLDEAAIRSGIGEMIKVFIIAGWDDVRAFAADFPRVHADRALLARYLRRALEIKREKVERDEFDRHERLVMNYGHTFGHAIESATDFAIPHGIAVTMGMEIANRLSCRMGLMDWAAYHELHPLLEANYAGFEQVTVPEEAFCSALLRDKKHTAQGFAMILLRAPGEVCRAHEPWDDRLRGLCLEALQTLAHRRGAEPCPSRA